LLFLHFATREPYFLGEPKQRNPQEQRSDKKQNARAVDMMQAKKLAREKIELGAKRKRSVGANDLTKIVFDLPTSVNENFARSLRACLVEKTTESWMFWYGLLETFIKEHGHCRVPQHHKTDDGYRLGGWLSNQRGAKDKMDPDRGQRLEALPGWSWDMHSDLWKEGFSYLKQFSNREGHCRVPDRYKTDDDYRLGSWVTTQRAVKDTMDPDRQQRLEALPGWVWKVEKPRNHIGK
jgi:hypothetical protein